MEEGYWSRQGQLHPSAGLLKRPRPDYDLPPSGLPSAHDMRNYIARDDDWVGPQAAKGTKSIGSAYDHYLQNAQFPPFASGEASNYSEVRLGRAGGVGASTYSFADPVAIRRPGAVRQDLEPHGRGMEYGSQLPVDVARSGHEILPLPRDASNTLYIEGLPPNSKRREVAHIFRPFVGYKEVRLVTKESKHRGGDPLIFCFVDFASPACAATALSALQGYKMDEHDPDSPYLRLEFSKHPGPRSGSGHRRRR